MALFLNIFSHVMNILFTKLARDRRVRISLGSVRTARTWGPFLEGPEKFSHSPERSLKNLKITELFYSRILNMNRDSLYTRRFRRVQLSVCR